MRAVVVSLLAATFSTPVVLGAQDTVRVTLPSQPAGTARLELEHTFSVPPGSRAFELRIRGLSDGRYLVYDGVRVVLRGRAGEELATVAQRGAGDGDLQSFIGMEVIGDSTVAIFDEAARSIRYYRLDGSAISSVAVDGTTIGGPFGVDRLERAFVRIGMPSASGRLEGEGSTSLFRCVPRSDSCSDIPAPRYGAVTPPGAAFILRTADGDLTSAGATRLLAFLPIGGVAWANSSAYAVFAVTGTRLVELRRDIAIVHRTSEEIAEWTLWARYFAGRRTPPSTPALIERVKPALQSILGDDAGRVWIGVNAPSTFRTDAPATRPGEPAALRWRPPVVFDLATLDGAYLAQLTLPPSSRLASVRGDRVWLLHTTADGRAAIGTYRLRIDPRAE